MGSSSGGTSNQSGSQGVQIPAFLQKFFRGMAKDYTSAQGNLPNISQLYGSVPMLNTPNLNSMQNSDISQFQNAVGNNADTSAGAQGLQNFIGGGANQPSAATQGALEEFNTLQAPAIQSAAGLSGLGNSGAMLQALQQGQNQALVPFMQQDLQNQLIASQGLGQLGLGEGSLQQTQLQNALGAANMPYQVQQQQMQDLFNQLQQQWGYANNIQTGQGNPFGGLLGQTTFSTGSSSAPKF